MVATVTVTEENFDAVPENILRELENDEATTIEEYAKE
jgi:hypothetical protein